jgi:hypothetical protein
MGFFAELSLMIACLDNVIDTDCVCLCQISCLNAAVIVEVYAIPVAFTVQ